ncbi:flagellar basal body rod protein FlgF [Legionella micdadei]|uniref:Flagellar basal-body rod protein FlgF n=1 Tax=Legionella micdadei TaxID=451 RepID=A0A098GF66_LEGMI|nr:flagellar basal body rod protein FlgF [Legionella micdadei]ARG97788.1 flagellar biosynthesis protein FlgF [Legionella micdadei]ARG99895.1 flagellar biosynthesis protein FlgF [Legionella micdadei]KTD28500.1 flagellar basal body rod protein FlgF [Legionella micdadei]NSL18731.1 flagellar basal body rod protein FlgF [Legionella micdadei]CEG60610.1 Flagellar biosynthesis protein FlgF [Legionella micdadei]
MDPVLYHSMNASQLDFYRQNIIGHNMANINSPGFKADLFRAQSLYVTGSVQSSEALAVAQSNGTDFSDGPLISTGRDLDVAVLGDGWFVVQDSQGKEAYTQAGNFHITENGMLVNGSNRPVIGDGGPISIPPAQRVEIGTDGTISIVPFEGPPGAVVVLDRLKLVKLKSNELYKDADGLMKLTGGGTAQTDASINVVKGALEGSNVNPVEQMIHMINSGQGFNAKMKIVGAVDSNAQKLAQLLQL